MHPKNIWYISKYVAPPAQASAGSRGFMLMRELVRMGHKCTIIASDSNGLANCPQLNSGWLIQDIDGIQFCWVRTLKYKVAKSIKRILSWIDFEFKLLFFPLSKLSKPDAIIVSSLSLLTILNGIRLRRRYRCRLIFEIRDIWPLTLTEEGGFSPKNPLVRAMAWIERLGYRHADDIVGTMPNLAEHVEKILGYPREVHCIPMGIDPATINDIESLPDEYIHSHIPKDKFIVAHVGSIGITNALDSFFDCAASLTSESKIHFLLVGNGDLRDDYINKYGHFPNVSFAPSVPKRMVQSVLSRCDLLYFSTHPSKVWRYGQSLNKVIDYMLSGKPIVASYSGYPSMINEAGCGTFVPTGDIESLKSEIMRYADMPKSERQIHGTNGREWILNKRNYKDLAEQYLNVIFPPFPASNKCTTEMPIVPLRSLL